MFVGSILLLGVVRGMDDVIKEDVTREEPQTAFSLRRWFTESLDDVLPVVRIGTVRMNGVPAIRTDHRVFGIDLSTGRLRGLYSTRVKDVETFFDEFLAFDDARTPDAFHGIATMGRQGAGAFVLAPVDTVMGELVIGGEVDREMRTLCGESGYVSLPLTNDSEWAVHADIVMNGAMIEEAQVAIDSLEFYFVVPEMFYYWFQARLVAWESKEVDDGLVVTASCGDLPPVVMGGLRIPISWFAVSVGNDVCVLRIRKVESSERFVLGSWFLRHVATGFNTNHISFCSRELTNWYH
jgi:hypothetical protein